MRHGELVDGGSLRQTTVERFLRRQPSSIHPARFTSPPSSYLLEDNLLRETVMEGMSSRQLQIKPGLIRSAPPQEQF